MDTTELNIGREAFFSLIAKLIMAVIGFGGIIVFSRELGAEGIGSYYFVLAFAHLLARTSEGIGGAIKKRVSEIGSQSRELLGLGLLSHFLYFTIVSLVAISLLPKLAVEFENLPITFAVISVFGTVGLFSIVNKFYAGIGYPANSIWMDTVRSIITIIFQLLLLQKGLQEFGLLIGLAGASLITAVIVSVAANTRPTLPSRETITRTTTFARWSIPTAFTAKLYEKVDVLIIGTVVGSVGVGYYESALRLVIPASLLAASISNPLNVKTSSRSSIGDDIRADIENALSYAGLFAIPIFFGALALSSEIMRTVYGSEFGQAGPALIGISLFQIFNVYQNPLGAAIDGADYPRSKFRVRVVVLVVHVPLAIVSAIYYGLLGVIATTVVANVYIVCGYQYVAREKLGGVFLPHQTLWQFVSGFVMFGFLVFASRFITITDWYWLIAIVLSGAVVYFGFLLAVSSHFRMTIFNVASSQSR